MPGTRSYSPPSARGSVPAADPRLLTGVLFGQLGAVPAVRDLYEELTKAPEFSATAAWAEVDPASFDGLLLPGGHAPECGSTSARRCCGTR